MVLTEAATACPLIIGQVRWCRRPAMASAAAVNPNSASGFLQHTLSVTDDDVGSPEFHTQAFQSLLRLILRGGGTDKFRSEVAETATVEGSRTRTGPDDRDDFEDHPFGAVAGFENASTTLRRLVSFFWSGTWWSAFFAQSTLGYSGSVLRAGRG